jgi:hypothetical protein
VTPRHATALLLAAAASCAGCAGRPAPTPPGSGPRVEVGNCYENAFDLVALLSSDSALGAQVRASFLRAGLDPRGVVLVHGVATHPSAGHRFAHAWVEVGACAIDVSRSLREEPLYLGPKDEYYRRLQVREGECARYPPEEARRLANLHRHKGPWRPLPDDVLRPEDLGLAPEARPRRQ